MYSHRTGNIVDSNSRKCCKHAPVRSKVCNSLPRACQLVLLTAQSVHTCEEPAADPARREVSWSSDGRYLAAASAVGVGYSARVWDASTGTVLQDLDGHRDMVTVLSFYIE